MGAEVVKMPSSVAGLRDTAKVYFSKYQSARARMAKAAQENEKRIEGMIETVEVIGMAWAIPYWNGKSGPSAGQPYQIAGYDSDLVVGAGLVGLGLFELAGKYDEHLYALGAGALAAWGTRQGWAQGGKARTGGTTAGVAPAGAYSTGVAPAGTYAAG